MTILQQLTKEAELSKEQKYILGKVLRGTAIGGVGGGVGGGVVGHGKKGALIGAGLGAMLSGGKALIKKNKDEEEKKK